jgi:hypothetical protein
VLTVIFSSRNGGPVLDKTLTSMTRLRPPPGGWKIVAVNNASTDETPKIFARYRDRLPLTVLEEPQSGKNRALNRALGHGEGDLFVFCDDDVVVDQDWLVHWRQTADHRTRYDLFAGVTAPLWPYDPPRWILEEVDCGIVFATNRHMREGPCEPLAIFGTNMAVRAEVFASGVRFNTEIGPNSDQAYPMGSETELSRRLAALGYKCWFATSPQVKHIVRPGQMERQAILMRGYRWGRGQAHMHIAHTYAPDRLGHKNKLRSWLYPFLMPFYTHREAWARQWEWAIDQGYEDGLRECSHLAPLWLLEGACPRIAGRFRRAVAA